MQPHELLKSIHFDAPHGHPPAHGVLVPPRTGQVPSSSLPDLNCRSAQAIRSAELDAIRSAELDAIRSAEPATIR
jgi:hypothetical protein